jgi:UDP-2,3-diacylglucosamine hydrolase
VAQALRSLSRAGVPLYFAHGNRDFLLGTAFADRTGMRLLGEETVIDLYGRPALLMHGDSLCTDDQDYMTFREHGARHPLAIRVSRPPLGQPARRSRSHA